MTAALGRRVAAGAAWMVAMRLLARMAGLINMIVLARLLTPADFGIVALATAFIGAFAALSDLGLNAVLIQHQSARREHYDTVFTLTALRGLAIAALVWFGADAAAAFFEAPALADVARALALVSVMEGMRSPAVVNLVKNLDFRRDFMYMAAPRLIQVTVSITVAVMFWADERALIAALLAGGLVSLVLSYVLAPFLPRPGLRAWRDVIGYAKWMLSFNLLSFAFDRFDAFVIGRMMGPAAVSLFMLATTLANLATTEFAMPVRRAILPGYARLQAERAELRAHFALAFGAIAMIAAPMAAGVGLVAEPLVSLAFGERWTDAAPVLQILTVYGLLRALSGNCQSVIMALGAPRAMTPVMLAALAVGVPGMALGLHWGALPGAAWAMVAMGGVYLAGNLRAALGAIALSPRALVPPLLRCAGALVIMTLAVRGTMAMIPPGQPALSLLGAILAGMLSYPAALMTIWALLGAPPGPEAHAWRLIRRRSLPEAA